jgi:hypothetical protein
MMTLENFQCGSDASYRADSFALSILHRHLEFEPQQRVVLRDQNRCMIKQANLP